MIPLGAMSNACVEELEGTSKGANVPPSNTKPRSFDGVAVMSVKNPVSLCPLGVPPRNIVVFISSEEKPSAAIGSWLLRRLSVVIPYIVNISSVS